jgi:SM-20-related protein
VDADRVFCTDDDLIEGLRAEGIAVRDRFLDASHLEALNECAAARRGRGDFADARIGAGRALERRADIRGDSICWLEEPLLFPAERELFALFEQLRRSLNQHLFLGLYDLEQHYACYPAGAGYARHVDQPRGHGARRLSSIVYLNEQWRESDGGVLRCLTDHGEFRDIEPVGGRLVLFLTEGREHEVLRTSRQRLSIAGWFLARQCHALR